MHYRENKIIELVKKSFLVPSDIKGIGDDCAVIPHGDNNLIISTDSLVEDIHFLRNKITPFDLGYKSINASLSDIAAMGGTNKYCFCSLSIPKDIPFNWIEEFTKGMKQATEEFGAFILGGDTTDSTRDIFINVTVVGEAKFPKYRHTAKIGDVICATGILGESRAGLDILLNDISITEQNKRFVEKHNKPKAHTEEGKWLGEREEVTAMMDISDGVKEDIQKMFENSEIYLDKLPISDELIDYIKDIDKARELAFTSGEEYCLLLTVNPNRFAKLQQEYMIEFKKPLYEIGVVAGLFRETNGSFEK